MGDWGVLGDLAGKATDKIVDGVDAGIDKGKELVGEGVDYASDKAGAYLRDHGQAAVAEIVEDTGDKWASSLGAEVGEQQLGQTEEANELIHGNPTKIADSVKNLRDFQKAFDLVGAGMKRLDSSHWKGEGADTFRKKFSTLPTDWLHAADAFEAAAGALERYSNAITSAQSKAREAIALYKEGRHASAAHAKDVAAYEASRDSDKPLPKPGTDPGDALCTRAQEILDDARKARNEAADIAKDAVRAALAHAPEEPKGREKLKLELADWGVANGVENMHLLGGIVKGTAGLVNFVRSVNPLDIYNLTHPAEYYKGVNMTLAGLVSTAANPDRALKNAWDAAKGDPSEFIGRLIPELIGTKGSGLLRGGLRAGMRHGKPDGTRGDHDKNPDSNGKQCSATRCDGDPIDVATGRMLLPQTDIALPGSLQLVFKRTFDSSRRALGWFGPGWSSTVDQRLVIDSEGVIFSCDEGSLLAYPHPAPGVPVMPTHGRRWPLNRVDDGYTITDPDTGQVWHFADHSDELALLAQIDDRNGRWISFEYDEAGAPTSIVHHGGYHLKLTTSDGRITALHLAGAAPDGGDQEVLRYGYTDGHLTDVINSSGRPLRFGYDEHGRITSWTDTNGSHYDYVYDDQDRCVYQTGSNGHMESRFTWDDTDPDTGLRMTSMTDGLGHTKRFVINERSQVVAEVDATGAVTRFEYDRHNRLLALTDALGHLTRSTYDEHGRLTTVVRPDGRHRTAQYDDLGRPTAVVRAGGVVTRQAFDERGNRTAVTDASGATTRYSYDDTGHLASLTDALGHTSTVRCDKAGLPVAVTDPLGATTRYERDAFGRPVALFDALGAVTRLEWTVEGKLARRVEADSTQQSWTYDGEGNCLTHTNAMGEVSTFEYTDFALLAAQTGPDGVRYTFTHDSSLRLTQVTNSQGLTWNYEYDPVGRLISETDFDDRRLTYAYDASGRLTSYTNGLGQTIRFEHNELGQLLRKDSEGVVTTYEYDIFDELAVASSPSAILTRLRDRFGRLRSETVNGRTISFEYDLLGRRIGRTTPFGAVSTWVYDASGRRSELTTSGRTLTFERDAAGQELARHIGENLILRHEFDSMGRLTDQQVTGHGRSIQRRRFSYRGDGNLLGFDDQLSGARTFELDVVGRVTSVRAVNWTERYAYDDAGNQREASWPSSHPGGEATGTRLYAGTRITRAGSVRYEHDAQGRIVLRQKTRLSRKPDTWLYQWDAEDRLTSVTTPDGTVWRYDYDALGRRIAKQRLAQDNRMVLEQVTFTWDGTTLCEQTTDVQNLPSPVTLTWDHDGLRPLAQTERIVDADAPRDIIDERFFSIITDLVGAPSELIDESGDLAWHLRRTLWGATTWATTSTTYTPLRFPGQYFDPETGLHYNFHRHYDPETARYLTLDPLGLAAAPNPATYVHNPHTWIDPYGLAPECPPKGEKSNPFKHRQDAERAAFDVAGVPYGTTPDAQWVVMGDKTMKHMPGHVYSKDPTHWGNFRQFETDDGARVVVEHTHDPAGPHFHAGAPKGFTPEERSRNFVNFGWDNSVEGYGRMERYRALDKDGGDHHFFYEGN
ncbi:DUF6531 domain-containing protein [Streptomyces sp. NBC_00390]|uniref:putative T7SS-secreted protein n=1 Tax=Streptomyces sp. NBC_00390 TaxID=2975736 RepID=UPI002E1AAB3A